MTFEALHNAIRSRFHTLVATPNSLAVVYDNAPSPVTTSLWCRLTILDGQTFQASLGGAKRFRTPGLMVVQIFVPAESGDKAALQLVDKIVPLFRAVSVGGVTYQTPHLTSNGRVDHWWQVNLTCPFYADDLEGA